MTQRHEEKAQSLLAAFNERYPGMTRYHSHVQQALRAAKERSVRLFLQFMDADGMAVGIRPEEVAMTQTQRFAMSRGDGSAIVQCDGTKITLKSGEYVRVTARKEFVEEAVNAALSD